MATSAVTGSAVELCLRALHVLHTHAWTEPAAIAELRALFVDLEGADEAALEDGRPWRPRGYESPMAWRALLVRSLEQAGTDADAWWPVVERVDDDAHRLFLVLDVIRRLAASGGVERSRAYFERLPASIEDARRRAHRALLEHFASTADVARFEAELPLCEPGRAPQMEVSRAHATLLEAVAVSGGWPALRALVAAPRYLAFALHGLRALATRMPYAEVRAILDDEVLALDEVSRTELLVLAFRRGPAGFDRSAFEALLPRVAALDPKLKGADTSFRDDCLISLARACPSLDDVMRCRKLARGKLARRLLAERAAELEAASTP